MHTKLLKHLDDLRAIRSAWEQLEKETDVPMQQYIWAEACAAAFTKPGQLRILTVEESGQIVAIAPLVQRPGQSCLELLGIHELQEPTDMIYANEQALLELSRGLIDLGVPLFLRRIPADSPFVESFKGAYRGQGVVALRPDHPWSWTPLDPIWENHEKRLNSKQRANLRRHQRLAQELGLVTTEVISPTPDTLEPLLEEAFSVEASSWKGALGTAMAIDPVRGSFNRHYAAAACRKGILRLCFLRIGTQAAAMQMAIEYGGRFWLLKIGYDPQFARCSPGMLLLYETVRHAALKGLRSLEILGTIDPRTKIWAPLERNCVVARGYPFDVRGVTTLAGDAAKSVWQKLSRVGVGIRH